MINMNLILVIMVYITNIFSIANLKTIINIIPYFSYNGVDVCVFWLEMFFFVVMLFECNLRLVHCFYFPYGVW